MANNNRWRLPWQSPAMSDIFRGSIRSQPDGESNQRAGANVITPKKRFRDLQNSGNEVRRDKRTNIEFAKNDPKLQTQATSSSQQN